MMNIQVYDEGSIEREKLEIIADMLNRNCPEDFWADPDSFEVCDTWFDFGAGMMWTTISYRVDGDPVQGFSPKQQEEVLNILMVRDLIKWIKKFFDEGIVAGHVKSRINRKGEKA